MVTCSSNFFFASLVFFFFFFHPQNPFSCMYDDLYKQTLFAFKHSLTPQNWSHHHIITPVTTPTPVTTIHAGHDQPHRSRPHIGHVTHTSNNPHTGHFIHTITHTRYDPHTGHDHPRRSRSATPITTPHRSCPPHQTQPPHQSRPHTGHVTHTSRDTHTGHVATPVTSLYRSRV